MGSGRCPLSFIPLYMGSESIVVPRQKYGGYSDTSSEITLDSLTATCDHFEVVKKRLMNINDWGTISNRLADFQLTDSEGGNKFADPEEGDYIRINLPAPGTVLAGGYEWVKIEYIITKKSIMSDYESAAILVRPAPNPTINDQSTAHFFQDDATSTFLVRRDQIKITAEIHGRNEIPNINTFSVWDKIRNLIMYIGAILGFSKMQWKMLADGLVKLGG